MAKLQLSRVYKTYGNKLALSDISLTIDDNEFFCIFGPPGCGKTTILRLLLGLESPDSGTVLIDERVVNEQSPAERNLAMVFQNLALFPHMTAGQNLEFPLVERHVPSAEVRRRVGEVAEKLHIAPLLEKLPAHLSGGERQRVAIGRALVREPNALLMDEPISALDARLREEMRVELSRLQRELKRTLVYVTHDQEEALSVADRVCVLDQGSVVQIGTPQEVYNAPVNRYVAAVIGVPSINLVDGSWDRDRGTFSSDTFPFDVFVGDLENLSNGRLIAGIRPEDVRIDRATSGEREVTATIDAVEPLGAFTVVEVTAGTSKLRVQISGQPDFRAGEPVYLSFDSGRCHLFDGDSGRRLMTGLGQPGSHST